MRTHHARLIAGSVLLLGAAIQWSRAAELRTTADLVLLASGVIFGLLGTWLMGANMNRPD